MSASESVWALVSGLPRVARERRLLMVMQAYVDDSMTDGQVLVLAGYLAPSQNWAAFSDEWQEVLSIRPPWASFKMSEIVGFAGDESRERILHHFQIIAKYVHSGFAIAVPLQPFDNFSRVTNAKVGRRRPYHFAWLRIIAILLERCEELNIDGPIDFIFDHQSEAAGLVKSWKTIFDLLKVTHGERIKNFPIFRDDKEFLPLQAADLFAWIMRKKFLDFGTFIGNRHYEFPWGKEMLIPHTIVAELTPEEIIRMLIVSRFKWWPGPRVSYLPPAMAVPISVQTEGAVSWTGFLL